MTALIGVDFTCAPSRRKPITVARGGVVDGVVVLDRIDALPTLGHFDALLAAPGPWFGAFDFPFGLPRAFVDDHGLGDSTAAVIAALRRRCATRMDFRALVDAWCDRGARRLAHRATDAAMPGIRSSSPLQTRYVPVGFMYYEGLHRLVAAGVTLPRLHAGDPARLAVEGYPGLLAFELAGRRSYKNRDTPDRTAARAAIVAALQSGVPRLGLRLLLTGDAQRAALLDDASGDSLDAVLCLLQAGWAASRPHGAMPDGVDAVEGWIATAPQQPGVGPAATAAPAGAGAAAGSP